MTVHIRLVYHYIVYWSDDLGAKHLTNIVGTGVGYLQRKIPCRPRHLTNFSNARGLPGRGDARS